MEQYPAPPQAPRHGLAAATTKAGGMLGPLAVSGAPSLGVVAITTTIPVAAVYLLVTGTESAQRPLVELAVASS